jgi:phosphatidylglycerol:prolipoprotein diacylglycerol transferase
VIPVSLAAWLHTIDPYAVQLWEGGPIRWYGLSYLVGFVIAYRLIRRVARVGRSPMDPKRAGDLVIALALGAVAGGRLGYCVFYKPQLLIQFSSDFPFWGVLDMMGGGMASHGGMIGALVAAAWFARRTKPQPIPVAHVFDLTAFAAPLGLLCGRIANFINGELIGRRVAADFPLAVQFPQALYDDPALFNAFAEAYGREPPRRWLDLIQSGNVELQQAAAAVLPTHHPSQLYAGLTEGVVVFVVLAVLWLKPRRAGTIAGWFGIVYALMRLLNEQFREPDAHLGYQALGLTRGQWLSVGLLVAGVLVLGWTRWRKTPRLGGWREGTHEGVDTVPPGLRG